MNNIYSRNTQKVNPYTSQANAYFLNKLVKTDKPYLRQKFTQTSTEKPVFFEPNSSIDNLVCNYNLMPGKDRTGPDGDGCKTGRNGGKVPERTPGYGQGNGQRAGVHRNNQNDSDSRPQRGRK